MGEIIPWGFSSNGVPSAVAFRGINGGCQYKAKAGYEKCPPLAPHTEVKFPDRGYMSESVTNSSLTWNCDFGLESGSTCTKSCNEGWDWDLGKRGRPTTATKCSCWTKCRWSTETTGCTAQGCTFGPEFPNPHNGTKE